MGKLDEIRALLGAKLKEKKSETFSFGSAYNISEVPKIIEKKNKDWVYWGEDNLYPLKLKDMKTASAIHNAIVKTKTKLTAGDGLLINGATNEQASKHTQKQNKSKQKRVHGRSYCKTNKQRKVRTCKENTTMKGAEAGPVWLAKTRWRTSRRVVTRRNPQTLV